MNIKRNYSCSSTRVISGRVTVMIFVYLFCFYSTQCSDFSVFPLVSIMGEESPLLHGCVPQLPPFSVLSGGWFTPRVLKLLSWFSETNYCWLILQGRSSLGNPVNSYDFRGLLSFLDVCPHYSDFNPLNCDIQIILIMRCLWACSHIFPLIPT